MSHDWMPFSLALRERAGVRGKGIFELTTP